jgi:hypothetical protein
MRLYPFAEEVQGLFLSRSCFAPPQKICHAHSFAPFGLNFGEGDFPLLHLRSVDFQAGSLIKSERAGIVSQTADFVQDCLRFFAEIKLTLRFCEFRGISREGVILFNRNKVVYIVESLYR